MFELNDIIINILLQERTSNTKLDVNLNAAIPRYMKASLEQKRRT